MAIIKCKMCGGDLELIPGQSVAECEYCGSRQTVPVADNDKKMTLFARANRLRSACEFDKAAGVYESIVADFPEEAEAYWGLVLCKYGIEYVDDPATGKKIPTCHRSSFDSILEDSDFDQAQENADVVARKQYREEAKQIEDLRKGIVAVSANEQPYDIFICYKETDENGQRTLDSVLAQDIYDALTAKNYRVFFSRITLEDKLGLEYEPYIFAALNSAKIMLAVGTDYEYYNAVWVKNEWSRYLKLMAKDKDKHLIPCYKGIDAYDMPKEFARLQAQDLGKVGAMQDLLRGIEKILTKNQPTVVVQEQVVVGGVGGSKITSLLDRGNMALEDGDWNKAMSFFEDVLNNDSKNAQAYLGETLALEKCHTMDAFARKRKEVTLAVTGETLELEANSAHIAEMAEKYQIPGYCAPDAIRKFYDFDLSYHSDVAERKNQYHAEERYWDNHKQLSRAEKFATGEVAKTLQQEKQALFAALKERITEAEQAEAKEIAGLKESYAAHLRQADEKAEALYQSNVALRERNYQSWLEQANQESSIEKLLTLASQFEKLNGYRDSDAMAEHCKERRKDEMEKMAAERAQKAEIARREAERIAKRNKRIAVICTAVAAVALSVILVVTKIIVPNAKYNDAVSLMEAGQYEEAIAAFEAMDGYKDSIAQVEACQVAILEEQYQAAVTLMEEGKYEEAIAAFQELADYKDSAEQIENSNAAIQELQMKPQYDAAVALENSGETAKAAMAFSALGDYQDARVRSFALWEDVAVRNTLFAASAHTVALRLNGTVVAVGDNKYDQCDVSDWTDIVSVSATGWHTVGLKSDGTVVAVGDNEHGECDVSDWTDIVAIGTGAWHTVGQRSDGTVVAVGHNYYGQCDVFGWTDIIAVSTGGYHTVGLKSDGTVVAVGDNKYGQCDVSDWTDIVAVGTGWYHTVGLKSDGTVVAVGDNQYGQCDISDWTDIVTVSACGHTVGLKSDGTVVAVGDNEYGQCDISDWTDIVAVSAGACHTVGLKSDGTVVAVGDNTHSECKVSDWTDIKVP